MAIEAGTAIPGGSNAQGSKQDSRLAPLFPGLNGFLDVPEVRYRPETAGRWFLNNQRKQSGSEQGLSLSPPQTVACPPLFYRQLSRFSISRMPSSHHGG